MTVLTDEAEQARIAREAQEAADLEQARTDLRNAAKDAVKAMLVRPDGTFLSLSASGLAMVYDDLDNGVAVASDGNVSLAAHRGRDGSWGVYLVTGSGSDWVKASGDLNSLADLGEALVG